VRIEGCCISVFRPIRWRGRPGLRVICPRCRRLWSWEDGAWWRGPIQPEPKEGNHVG